MVARGWMRYETLFPCGLERWQVHVKITFIAPCADTSGGFRVTVTHAEHLQKRGHDVLIVYPPHRRPSFKEQVRSIVKGQGWVRPPRSHHAIAVPHRMLERARPIGDADLPDADIVIATWWETAEWVAKLSRCKGAKAYFIQHHEVFDYLPRDRSAATYGLPLHKITISKWLVELMQSHYGDPCVSLVPNSVDTRQFFAPSRGKQAVPTLGFLYSTIYWKDCRTSLEAIRLIRERVPELRVIAFGQERPSADLPLPEGTVYERLPLQASIKDIYASCDVWLCGSLTEGFHLPPLEAMACRCPVVSTAVGGPIDVLEDGVNGYVVPVRAHAALADRALAVLSLSDRAWRAMSDAAYRRAVGYSWDDAAVLFERALSVAIDRDGERNLSKENEKAHC